MAETDPVEFVRTQVVEALERRAPDLPGRLFRVVADVGYGFPELTHRERTGRNFQRADTAARWIRNLEWPPGHHLLVGVFVSDCAWTEISPGQLGPLAEEVDVED